MNLPGYGSSSSIGDDPAPACNVTTAYADIGNMEGTEFDGYYAEWADFDIFLPDGDPQLSLIRLLWAGILSYVQGTSSDTIYGTNSALKLVSDDIEYIDHFYVQNIKDPTGIPVPYGAIGDTNSSEGTINDPTMLNIQLLEATSYDVRKGMHQAGCDENATAIQGQGYLGSAQQLGYCRSKFFNRITLYTLIGFLVLWVLSLPVFLIIRGYVNKGGASAQYMAAAKAQQNKTSTKPKVGVTQETSPEKETTSSPKPSNSPTSNDTPTTDETPAWLQESPQKMQDAQAGQSGMELASVSNTMRRSAQNQALTDQDKAQVQKPQVQPTQTQPQGPQPSMDNPLADRMGGGWRASKNKRKRKRN
jgi:hypothetical protein